MARTPDAEDTPSCCPARYLAMNGRYKYVVFGTGKEVPPQLFDIANDVGEHHNLASTMYVIMRWFLIKWRKILEMAFKLIKLC